MEVDDARHTDRRGASKRHASHTQTAAAPAGTKHASRGSAEVPRLPHEVKADVANTCHTNSRGTVNQARAQCHKGCV